MAHQQQRDFVERVRVRWPHLFTGRSVLDVGSLNVNGTNRDLFTDCRYIGLDIVGGDNVDVICPIAQFRGGPFGAVISTEMLEHDADPAASILRMIDLLSPDGLLLLTCATIGREEHGTTIHRPEDSPGTNETYRNIHPDELRGPLSEVFTCWSVEVFHTDLYAWGVNKR